MARKKNVQYYGTGRRKSSIARVFVKAGKGVITVNGRDVNDYMPYATLVMDLKQPLTLANVVDKFDVECTVAGGGFTGQAGAIRLGIARALLEAGIDRSTLKVAGMLSRDARSKERKKYGLKAARRAPQFSKR
ncbi:MAG: 30S ribosomal protein S9 [Bacilli bacterium]|jgi:small subunit ribosomal protein S9|nr:30S ribosomal protein S9 [Bacilli bacterium]MDD3389289.1 30S ribosomal protein S9 [Bacilli bacterium]MDD4344914.1 30S ribosomal protein S9 [Bacilli bacterium]MDD4520723.1 30S ribosomal protein S9 [Bacilli bacterium]MDY0399503.1 30S ribosomal protein S9 [Bacilli bacterium]